MSTEVLSAHAVFAESTGKNKVVIPLKQFVNRFFLQGNTKGDQLQTVKPRCLEDHGVQLLRMDGPIRRKSPFIIARPDDPATLYSASCQNNAVNIRPMIASA